MEVEESGSSAGTLLALGEVTTNVERCIKKLGIKVRVEHLQKTAALGTARIFRKHATGTVNGPRSIDRHSVATFQLRLLWGVHV